MSALTSDNFEAAAKILDDATNRGVVRAASLLVRQGKTQFSQSFGACKSEDGIFLIASISKPMSVAALMTLYARNEFDLDDRVETFIPQFRGDGREAITMRQLFTHLSGLPDQLPENARLRAQHAPLAEFVSRAIKTPLLFEPGTKYSYSSMGILLASEVVEVFLTSDLHLVPDDFIFVCLHQ